MAQRRERPGVMLYFDVLRPAIKRLDDAQCGALFRSLVEYAQYGVVPELDAMTGMAFDMLVPKIDRDAERYEESREQRQYATYVRDRKKTGEPYLSITEWRLSQDQKDIGPISPDNENNGPYPSASPTPTTSTTTSPTAAAAASPSASKTAFSAPAGAGEGYKGEGRADAFVDWVLELEKRPRASPPAREPAGLKPITWGKSR